MTKLDWTDVLDLGMPELDKQHKKLISLANDLLLAIAAKKADDALEDLFEQLKDYTEYHFSTEEIFMEEIGYPHIKEHSAEHALLVKRVESYRDSILDGKKVSTNEVLDFLMGWIVAHIMEKDALIGLHAKEVEE